MLVILLLQIVSALALQQHFSVLPLWREQGLCILVCDGTRDCPAVTKGVLTPPALVSQPCLGWEALRRRVRSIYMDAVTADGAGSLQAVKQ